MFEALIKLQKYGITFHPMYETTWNFIIKLYYISPERSFFDRRSKMINGRIKEHSSCTLFAVWARRRNYPLDIVKHIVDFVSL